MCSDRVHHQVHLSQITRQVIQDAQLLVTLILITWLKGWLLGHFPIKILFSFCN